MNRLIVVFFFLFCYVFVIFRLYPKLLLELIPNLGLVIDLTNTTKYYLPSEFEENGVNYTKIFVEGHVVPKRQCINQYVMVQTICGMITD